MTLSISIQHNDIQDNNIQHNDIQHNEIEHDDIQHNDIQHNDTQHDNKLNVTFSKTKHRITHIIVMLIVGYAKCHLC